MQTKKSYERTGTNVYKGNEPTTDGSLPNTEPHPASPLRSKITAQAHRLTDALHVSREKVSLKLQHLSEDVKTKGTQVAQEVKVKAAGVSQDIKNQAVRVDGKIKAAPYAYVLGAVGVGFILGRMSMSRFQSLKLKMSRKDANDTSTELNQKRYGLDEEITTMGAASYGGSEMEARGDDYGQTTSPDATDTTSYNSTVSPRGQNDSMSSASI